MSSIDERTVKMKFDNAEFKKGAAETKQSLTDVNAAVDAAGKGKGLLNLAGHMETVKVKASAMQVAAVTAMANITNRAVNMGINVAKSLSLDPIKAGFDEYELKMKSIQTILANTKGENLKTVTSALNELNEYSDKTIYNFGNMTDAIGKLTTAGISLDTATATVKGFSNMVALAGGNSEAARGALEQFGQGLQAGVIRAMDWQSISTRGLGSQALQKSFFETARAAGDLKDVPLTTTFEEWTKKQGGFKNSLDSGWLSADVATKTLSIMTGDVKGVGQLMKQGFSRKAAEDMLKTAESALESATKVRTFTGFMDTLKEQIGSGWSGVFENLIGNFNQSTKLFTGLSDLTGKAIGGFFGYLEALTGGFRKMGGVSAVLGTISNLLAPIGAILGVIAEAWTTAFPSGKAGSGLASVAKGLELVTRPLQIVADVIRRSIGPITAFFRILSIGKQVVVELAKKLDSLVQDLFGMIDIKAPDSGGFLDFVKKIAKAVGGAVEQVDELLKKGSSLKDAFSKVDVSLPGVPDLPSLGGLLNSPAAPAIPKLPTLASGGIAGIKFNPDAKLDRSRVTDSADQIGEGLNNAADSVSSGGNTLLDVLKRVGNGIMDFLDNLTLDDILSSFNLAILGTFMFSISRFLNTLTSSFTGFVGVGDEIKNTFTTAQNGIKTFQKGIQSKIILNIAIALGILALSLWLLSTIPAEKLATAMVALASIAVVLKYSLEAVSTAVEKMDGKNLGLKMLALGGSMILFAFAILILAGAMLVMNYVDWASIAKGAAAMYILKVAMEALAEMKKDDLFKAAAAMVVVAVALLVFAAAIKAFSALSMETFAEGIAYAAISLALLATVMNGFTSSLAGALALVVVVGALTLLVGTIALFAALDLGTFAKGLAFVAASLLVLTIAMYGFTSSLAGAAALVVAVGALMLLVGVIDAFGNMDWGTFAKGIAMVTISFLVLGSLMALMGVFSPLILLGAAALLIFGGAMFLLGAGILFLAKGMAALILISGGIVAAITAMAVGLAIGFAVFLQTLALQAPIMKDSFLKILQTLIDALVAAVPMIIQGIKDMWAAIKAEFTSPDKNTLMGEQGKSWIEKVKDGIKEKIPAIVKAAGELLLKFIRGLRDKASGLGGEAAGFVAKLLDGIRSKISGVITSGTNLIIAFIQGIGKASARLARAAADVVITFINDLAAAIEDKGPRLGQAMGNLGVSMVQGLIGGVREMFSEALGAIGGLAEGMVSKAKSILKIFSPSRVFNDIGKFLVMGLTNGVQDNAAIAIKAVGDMVAGQIGIANEYVDKMIQTLDQKAIAARAKAEGLAAAAKEAEKQANKTKTKADDKKANKIGKAAEKASKDAEAKEKAAEAAKARQDREEEFRDASYLDKAKMRSEDAQNQLDSAKSYEASAAKNLEAANALDKQARTEGLSSKERKKLRKEADEFREKAESDARNANKKLDDARRSAGQALDLQKKAGAEAAAAYQLSFDGAAKTAAEEAAFAKLSNGEKAELRRTQAAEQQALADANLAEAKRLAYTDIEKANALATQANAQAEQARKYLTEAESLSSSNSGGGTTGTVVNLDPTDAAALAMNDYENTYSQAALASGDSNIEFNQYNTSPESLSDSEIYRKTNNQFAFAVDKLETAAA